MVCSIYDIEAVVVLTLIILKQHALQWPTHMCAYSHSTVCLYLHVYLFFRTVNYSYAKSYTEIGVFMYYFDLHIYINFSCI